MVGRPPKPTKFKQLAGNPGKRSLNKNEFRPERTLPARPWGLPGGAKKFWDEVAPQLGEAGLLTGIDGPALMFMAIQYWIGIEATKTIKEDGLEALDENGAIRKHPMLQVLRDSSKLYLQYAQQFGLTPSARARLSVPELPDADDYEAFLNDD